MKIGKNKKEVNVLQYVNDTFFICEDKIQNIMTLKCILRCFKLAYEIKVNFHKSKLGVIGIKTHKIDRFVTILNCKNMSRPFTYLEIRKESENNEYVRTYAK